MSNVTLRRAYLPGGTRGLMLDDTGAILACTIERTASDPDHPCIPEGTYRCELYDSPRHGRVYLLQDVPGRGYIEIHVVEGQDGTVDYVRPGFLLGCIGLGLTEGESHGEPAVYGSHEAFRRFMAAQNGEPFDLTIVNGASA